MDFNILVGLVFEITIDKVKKSGSKKTIFERGLKRTPNNDRVKKLF